jgi:lysyl-tRNA synthetase class 2
MRDEPTSHRQPGPSQLLRALGGVARTASLVLAVPLVVAATTGWLYWVRQTVASWHGPRVADALPLDELASHASVPFVVYVVAFVAGGMILGLLARVLRYDRTSATLVLAVGTGAAVLVIDTICIYIVRQIPLHAALRAAVHLDAVYLAGILAGLGGAVLGLAGRTARADTGGRRDLIGRQAPRWPRLLAWLTGLAGAADILSVLLPHGDRRHPLVVPFVSHAAVAYAGALTLPVGVVLLACARGLARRRHPALLIAAPVLGASALLHLVKGGLGLGGAAVDSAIALALLARRADFEVPAAPRSGTLALGRLAAFVAVSYTVGLLSLAVHAFAEHAPFTLVGGLVDTTRALIGLSPVRTRFLEPAFDRWFPMSIVPVVGVGVIWATATWLSAHRQAASGDDERRRQAHAVVRAWGVDTLAPFALRRDKTLYLWEPPAQENHAGPSGPVLISYRVVRGIALVSADPIGPPRAVPCALDAFCDFAHRRGWKVAIIGASSRFLDVYEERGLQSVYHGDEAVLDVEEFSLAGGARRAIRQANSRLQRRGYRCEVLAAAEVDEALQAELRDVERAWLRGRPRKGFVMELDDLFRLTDDEAVFVVGRRPDGRVAGFLHLAVCPAGSALSLSSMPRLDDLPNGFNAWLIIEAVAWARQHGLRHISLNFSPFAELLTSRADHSVLASLERGVLLGVKAALSLQLDNLHRFNQQFGPRPVARYVVFEHRTDLPMVALTAMASERYLPFSHLLTGEDPSAHPATERTTLAPASPWAARPAPGGSP